MIMTGELLILRLIRALAGIAWIGLLAFIGYGIFRRVRKKPIRHYVLLIVAFSILAVAINTVAAGLVFIQPNERGVIVTAASPGFREQALQPGLRWIIPYFESVVTYPISQITYTMSIAPQEGQIVGDDSVEARTLDGQIVLVDASVIFSVNPASVVDVHIRWQGRYVDGLVRPFARGAIRDAVALFRIDEFDRETLINLVAEILTKEFEANGFILHEFVLRNIEISAEQ